MSFCSKCGQKIQEGSAFCENCGEATTKNSDFNNSFNRAVINGGVKDEKQDIQDNKVLAILAYLGILVLVPIFAGKDSKFAKFHANQGLVNLIVAIAYYAAVAILNTFLIIILGRFGLLLVGLLNFAGIAFTALAIIGIVNAANGQMKELPIIGKLKILK